MAETIAVDYLVVGAGAMGMAFVDTMISDSKATVAIVDRYARPGGHWTTAYPYVRLHQPSAFYGVNSRQLGEDKIDQVGWNKGLVELATVDEVCAYYAAVMQQTFLPSGRVTYHPKHEYLGAGEWRSLVTGKVFRVGKDTTIVDATYMDVKVPSMGPPSYEVSADVTLVTPNDLPKVSRPYGGYTVIGAGKTGIDACLWLLTQGIDPQQIKWIMPRDPWFIERSTFQPGAAFAEKTAAGMAATGQSIMEASSTEDLFHRLDASAQLVRMTDKVWPTTFRCSTVSLRELEAVRKIGTIVRKGRVLRISAGEVTMEQGNYTPEPDSLYIDCSAHALAKFEPLPVFRGKQITLQPVRYCQQVFSAAFIAHVELTYPDETLKNELCRTIPFPDEAEDWLKINLQSHRNTLAWAAQPKTAAWLSQARLDFVGGISPKPPADPAEAATFYATLGAQLQAMCAKLEQLIDQLPQKDGVKAHTPLMKL